jgi:hypothetical protein
MKDVALKAKVSTATVSRALMNPDKVSQTTRNRVEQAALEVGYLPQAMGRNVKRNESRTILVIVPDICDPFFSEIIRGIEVTAAAKGYLVLIGDCAHQNQQEKTFIDLIITKQIDGMLLLGSRLPFDASIEEQRNLPPMVMANEFAPELELPTVHIDNLTAALFHQIGGTAPLATHHLVIAFPDVGVFGVQVCPTFRTFQNDLIVVIVHITQRIHGTNGLCRAFGLFLMELNFISLQPTVALIDINIAGKHGIVRVVAFGVIGGNGDRQIVRITLNQWAIIAGNAQHTLRGEIGCQSLLSIEGSTNHCGQEGGDTFFHTFYLLFRHQWLYAGKRSETILLIIAVPALILPVCEPGR